MIEGILLSLLGGEAYNIVKKSLGKIIPILPPLTIMSR
jgi:hypothetical protein